MKIEKVGNKYRVRKQINGIKYTFNFDTKPTQKMIQKAMDERNVVQKHGNSFKVCCNSYIESKKNVISPSTIKGYRSISRAISDEFMAKDIGTITPYDVQNEINRYAKDHDAKTVRNYHSFISSVLSLFRDDIVLRTRLPTIQKKKPYIPTREDVRRLLDASVGTQYEIPLKLACYGMRRSEICALTPEDIQGNKVIINKGLVSTTDNEFVVKSMPKTAASTREIYISDELAERIQEVGLYKGHPGCINKWMKRQLKSLGIEYFSLHKLRHYFVSVLSSQNVDEATILELGGYATDRVMKAVYRHSMSDENKKQEILNKAGLI